MSDSAENNNLRSALFALPIPDYHDRLPDDDDLLAIREALRKQQFDSLERSHQRWVVQYLVPRLEHFGHVTVSNVFFETNDILSSTNNDKEAP